jgi:S-DNA-T family DNA segregation ATPase FtsK/SpoIIIE
MKGARKPVPIRREQKQRGNAKNAFGIFVVGIGIILFICLLISPSGNSTTFISNLTNGIRRIMGRTAIALPVFVIWAGALMAFSSRGRVRSATLGYLFCIIITLCAIFHVFSFSLVETIARSKGYPLPISWNSFITASFNDMDLGVFSGGAIGAIIAYPLVKALAVWGSLILLFFLLIIFALMLFHVRIPELGQKIGLFLRAGGGSFAAWFSEKREAFRENKAIRAEERERRLAEEEEREEFEDEDEGDYDTEAAEELAPPPVPPRRPKPIAQKPERAERQERRQAETDIPRRTSTMYSEDIVSAEDAAAKARAAKSRHQEDIPAYLKQHKKTYDALDVLPDDPQGMRVNADVIDADELPLEPIVNEAESDFEPELSSFARPARQSPEAQAQPAGAVLRPTVAPWTEPKEEKNAVFNKFENLTYSGDYRFPPFQLLTQSKSVPNVQDTRDQDTKYARKLEETLLSFKITAKVVQVTHGPAVTRYELQPGPGVKVSSIVSLADDIALNMAARGVRIEAPIPGKSAIGIEIPNDVVQMVPLRDVLESDEAQNHPSKLAVALGKDITGRKVIANLVSMPHLLIAGATGSGKSVCINTIITSIIFRSSPAEVRLILIDPKVVELSVYNGIPHLEAPVVTNPKEAAKALKWAVLEMDQRYHKFAEREVRDIRGYNANRPAGEPLMPQIVVVIDELADLMLVASNDVEESIFRLAQLARAAGIHLIIATQRPSVNVITGVIKSNIPARIAFAVASQVDARTILDTTGAEKLIGKGDMLFAPQGAGKPQRVQGCYVSDEEVARVVDYVKQRHDSEYRADVIDYIANAPDDAVEDFDSNDAETDELLRQAAEICIEGGQASISMLQRRLRVGYARAGRLIDVLARKGVVGQTEGVKPRAILVSMDELNIILPK